MLPSLAILYVVLVTRIGLHIIDSFPRPEIYTRTIFRPLRTVDFSQADPHRLVLLSALDKENE